MKDTGSKLNTGKEKEEGSLKRGRSNSTTVVQRVPLGPGRAQVAPPVANSVNARVPLIRTRVPAITKRATRVVAPPVVLEEEDVRLLEPQSEMDIEEDIATNARETETEASLALGEQEVEAMIGVEDSEEEELDDTAQQPPAKIQRIWPEVSTDRKHKYQRKRYRQFVRCPRRRSICMTRRWCLSTLRRFLSICVTSRFV